MVASRRISDLGSIRVLVADGQPIFRHGLCELLSKEDGIQVVREAESAPDLLARMDYRRIDMVVMDCQLPGANGVEVVMELRRRAGNSLKIVVLSARADEQHLFECLRAGVDAYLPRSASSQMVAEAIRRVHQGRKLLTAGQTNEVVERFRSLARERLRERAGLSETELQILRHLAEGETYEEIGDALHLGKRTIQRKVNSAIGKMEANNRTQAVAEALRRGLI